MSKIKNLFDSDKTVEVEFGDNEDWFITLRYISREELLKLSKRNTKIVFDKKTHQKVDEIDSERFLDDYAKRVIVGWRGLTMKKLSNLIPINDSMVTDWNEEVEYSHEDAVDLLSNSSYFDRFINDTILDMHKLNTKILEDEAKN